MSLLGSCSPCPGGANPVILVNPDANVNVVVVSGNVVWIPQRIDPSQVCFDALANTDLGTQSTDPQGYDPGQVQPLLWNPDTCQVQTWMPPCPEIIAYDPGASSDPGVLDLDLFPVGTRTFYALNQVAGCIDAVYNCGTQAWVPFCGGAPVVGPSADRVCYDVTSWGSAPWSFDNVGGLWLVQGINRVTEACSAGAPVTVFAGAGNTQVTTAYDSFGGTGPTIPGTWGALTGWTAPLAPYIPNGLATGMIGYTPTSLPVVPQSANNAQRVTLRTNFGVAPGTATGPLRYRLDFIDTAGAGLSGALRYAAWDSVSNTLMPISSNAGAGVITPAVGGQSIYVVNAPGAGPTLIDFTVSLPGTVDPANVYLLVWNLGGTDMDEAHDNVRLTYQPVVNACCNDWSGVANLTDYLNSHDPNGSGWSIDLGNPNLICRSVAVGAGAQYSTLNGCTTPPIVPTVTPI